MPLNFFVIEGFYGAGKTSIIRKLKENFSNSICIKEPGSTFEGKEIRRVMNSEIHPIEQDSRNILYVASLVEASRKKISLSADTDRFIFCERWYHTLFAENYAAGVEEIYVHFLIEVLRVAKPKECIILESPFEVCMDRMKKSSKGQRILQLGEEYLKKLYFYYHSRCEGIKINSNRNISDTVSDILLSIRYANGE